jgi:hypothetical protein
MSAEWAAAALFSAPLVFSAASPAFARAWLVSAMASEEVDAGGGEDGWVVTGAGGCVGFGGAGCGSHGTERSVVGGGGGSVVVVVVAGAGTSSVSWICSPRTGAATPASAGPAAAESTSTVVVVTTDVVDVVDVVDVTGVVDVVVGLRRSDVLDRGARSESGVRVAAR